MRAFLIPLAAAVLAAPAVAADGARKPCRLPGLEHEAQCGTVQRPLDPAAPQGTQIDIHYAVLPALARNKKPDPVFFFAGGPGQSALDLAGHVSRLLARLGNRRDIVLVDQRGTGRSAPLLCDPPGVVRPLRDGVDPARQLELLRECRVRLQALPHGDLRQYTTTIAVQDTDAVRRAIGAEQINLVGSSYGTRAVLEYMRQFPQAVRRALLDGVAPPDMVLPASFEADAQTAFETLLAACASEAACAARHPDLRAQWHAVLAALPREVTVTHPLTGGEERFMLTRDAAGALARAPLYAPALASALPHAVAEAAAGRYTALVGLASALRGGSLAMGMHFSVICAEDVPGMSPPDRSKGEFRRAKPEGTPVTPPDRSKGEFRRAQPEGTPVSAGAEPPRAGLGSGLADLYTRGCAGWPQGDVPPAFYTLPPALAATLLLSGGLDPVTPPRHGERVAQALGPKARHVVVPNAGHGLLALACLRDAAFRFVDAETDALALQVDADCARDIPRPPAFAPLAAAPEPAR